MSRFQSSIFFENVNNRHKRYNREGANNRHDVTDLINYGMVKNTKTRIS